jgi:hypothetical protein
MHRQGPRSTARRRRPAGGGLASRRPCRTPARSLQGRRRIQLGCRGPGNAAGARSAPRRDGYHSSCPSSTVDQPPAAAVAPACPPGKPARRPADPERTTAAAHPRCLLWTAGCASARCPGGVPATRRRSAPARPLRARPATAGSSPGPDHRSLARRIRPEQQSAVTRTAGRRRRPTTSRLPARTRPRHRTRPSPRTTACSATMAVRRCWGSARTPGSRRTRSRRRLARPARHSPDQRTRPASPSTRARGQRPHSTASPRRPPLEPRLRPSQASPPRCASPSRRQARGPGRSATPAGRNPQVPATLPHAGLPARRRAQRSVSATHAGAPRRRDGTSHARRHRRPRAPGSRRWAPPRAGCGGPTLRRCRRGLLATASARGGRTLRSGPGGRPCRRVGSTAPAPDPRSGPRGRRTAAPAGLATRRRPSCRPRAAGWDVGGHSAGRTGRASTRAATRAPCCPPRDPAPSASSPARCPIGTARRRVRPDAAGRRQTDACEHTPGASPRRRPTYCRYRPSSLEDEWVTRAIYPKPA